MARSGRAAGWGGGTAVRRYKVALDPRGFNDFAETAGESLDQQQKIGVVVG